MKLKDHITLKSGRQIRVGDTVLVLYRSRWHKAKLVLISRYSGYGAGWYELPGKRVTITRQHVTEAKGGD